MLTKEHTSLHSLSILSCYVAILPKCNWSINITYYYQKYLDGQKKQVSKSRKKHLPGSLAMFQHYFSKQEGLRHMQDDIADIRLAARESLLEASSDGLVV